MYIGIEGGGTRTRFFIEKDRDQAVYLEEPVSIKVRAEDFSSAARKLQEMFSQHSGIFDTLEAEGLEFAPRIAIGLSGMSKAEHQDRLRVALQKLPEFSRAKIHIEGDGTLALKAAIADGEEGILLIAGTGSVAYAKSKSGHIERFGGYGPPDSDEGSGYWIGKKAFESGDWRPENNTGPNRTEQLAALAPLVFKAAMQEKNPRYESGKKIIYGAATCLASLIQSVHIPGEAARPSRVFLSGSIAKQPLMIRNLQSLLPDNELIKLDDEAPARKALEIAKSLV